MRSHGRHITLLLTLAAALLPAAPAAASPLAQWRFDEPGGQTATDSGPAALHGRLGASTAADGADPERIAGRSGGALRFDGDAFVRLPSTPALAPATLTAEAVVRAPASPGQWRYIVSRGSSGCIAGAYGLYTGAAGGVAIYVFDGERYLVSATARPADVWDGAWHRVTGTFDGTALRMYVDGRPVGDPMPAPLRIDYDATSSRAQIGQYGGDCDLAFAGDLDEVTLWGSALSAGEVAGPEQQEQPPGGLPPAEPVAPLPAAEPGTIIPGPPALTPPVSSDPSGCTVRAARTRVMAGRRVVVKVRVTKLGRARRAARVVARSAGRRKALSSVRVGVTGRARLVLRLQRAQTVVIGVAGRPGCSPAYVRVTR